ncbi:MAG: hypothetical protein P4L46_19000 [Fimbriimonas sp.]|nr:hypothetical protein [Fimbriimonas sp.]
MSDENPSPPPINTPPAAPPPAPPARQPDPPGPTVIDTLIPARNGNALISYYLGLFSIFPVLGLIMGAVAVRLGMKGLAAAKENPSVAGGTHAKVGIGCGAIGFLFNLAFVALIVAAIIGSQK